VESIYPARAVGEYAEKGSWSGRVVTAHDGALNLLREDGLLVSVVAEESFMTAMSVFAPTVFDARNLADVVGRPAELQGSRLLLSGLSPIELRRAKTWRGHVQGNAGKAVPAEKVLLAEHALARLGKPGGLLGVLSSRAPSGPFAAQALRALGAGRPELLVGLGPGMTPAGDDFLAGVLLAGRADFTFGVSGPRIDAKAIEAALPGTAPAGRTLLWLALRGSFPSYLCSFMEGLAGAETEKELEKAVRAACSHGETSGTDALAGFFLAAAGVWTRLPGGRICATQGSA
jgi:hypothetical protein